MTSAPITLRDLAGLDVSRLKGDFPLLEQFGDDDTVRAAVTYALALGWEVFGPSLLEAVPRLPPVVDDPGEPVSSPAFGSA